MSNIFVKEKQKTNAKQYGKIWRHIHIGDSLPIMNNLSNQVYYCLSVPVPVYTSSVSD